MRELPDFAGDYQEPTTSESDIGKPKKSLTRYNMEANIDNADRQTLSYMGYPRPNDLFNTSTKRLGEIHDEVKDDIKIFYIKFLVLREINK